MTEEDQKLMGMYEIMAETKTGYVCSFMDYKCEKHQRCSELCNDSKVA